MTLISYGSIHFAVGHVSLALESLVGALGIHLIAHLQKGAHCMQQQAMVLKNNENNKCLTKTNNSRWPGG